MNEESNIIKNIINYLSDKLSNKERHAFEKEISKDPFLEDAMDGFTQLSADELENDLNDLSTRLQKRIDKPKSRKLMPYLRIAAGIAIIIGIGSVIIYRSLTNLSDKDVAQTIDISKGLDSIQRNLIPNEQTLKIINELKSEVETKEQMAQAATPTIKKSKSEAAKNFKLESPISDDEIISQPAVISAEMELANEDEENMVFTNIADSENKEVISEALSGKVTGLAISEPSSIQTAPKAKEITFSIRGTVVDADTKEPIIGASISSNAKGVITNTSGNFDFKIVNDSIIQVAFIGYETKNIPISELANNKLIELKVDNLALEEVVVVGYGTQKKSMVTGSISRIKSSDISGIPERAAGVSVKKSDSKKREAPNQINIIFNDTLEIHCAPIDGIKNYEKYIKRNVLNKLSSKQTATIEITVNADGSFGDIIILEDLKEIDSNEIIRLITEGPEWKSASNDGIAVKEKVTLSITFKE